tara:strand:- start:233 stop:664 length:432 start_codon:yes stop_codon:yes gene_type:complete
MILISHRGNVSGKDKVSENKPEYILNALNLGYEAEVDVWEYKEKLYLGHDEPSYLLDEKLLNNKSQLWIHAKNLNVLEIVSKLNLHYFWHQEDDITITSKGYWWTYPGKKLFQNSICVLPEKSNFKMTNCAGICSDYIERYKN